MAETGREKYAFKNTLVCLLKAIEGQITIVELRNETSVRGRIINVDGFMNITLQNVTFKTIKGKIVKFSDFFVQGVMVRFVQIPDYINIRKAIESEVYSGVKHKEKVSEMRRKNMEKRMERKKKYQEKEDKKRQAKMLSQGELSVKTETTAGPSVPPEMQEYPDIL